MKTSREKPTKASRIRLAAGDKVLSDFGLRRAHGLAAEYCVYFTIMDGLSLGFKAVLIGDAMRLPERENLIGSMSSSALRPEA